MSMAAESLEIRMARLEGAYEQIERRLGTLEAGLRDLRREMVEEIGGGRQEIQARRTDMRQQFYWVIGLIVVTILVPIASLFLPA